MDAGGLKGAWEALVFYVHPAKTAEIQRIAAHAQWFEDRMPWDAQVSEAGRYGLTANAIEVVIETGDSGPVTPVRHQPAERSGDPGDTRQQVGLALEHARSVREVDAARSSAPSSLDEEEVDGPTRWGAFAERVDDQHARSHRPRIG